MNITISEDELWKLIKDWCGSAYCMSSDIYEHGECACFEGDNGFEFEFGVRPEKPCLKEECPLLKQILTNETVVENQ